MVSETLNVILSQELEREQTIKEFMECSRTFLLSLISLFSEPELSFEERTIDFLTILSLLLRMVILSLPVHCLNKILVSAIKWSKK